MTTFPFLPTHIQQLLENESDGPQLYRHLIHPRIPNLGFAGFNHCSLHIPAVEVGTLWLCAYIRGEITPPSVEDMEGCIERIKVWKRANIEFEPSRSVAVNTRFQQNIDILLKELGVRPYQKLPNIFGEIFGRYSSSDYKDIVKDFNRAQLIQSKPLVTLPIDT